VDQVPVLLQANDKSLFLPLLQKLIKEPAPISSTVESINTFIPQPGAYGLDQLKQLVILAPKLLRLLR
jgi:hypothetical protein